MSMKNPLTPSGNETDTFRFVAQHVNHCATAVPILAEYLSKLLHKSRYAYTNSRNDVPYISKHAENKYHQFYMHKYTKSLFYTLVAFLKKWA